MQCQGSQACLAALVPNTTLGPELPLVTIGFPLSHYLTHFAQVIRVQQALCTCKLNVSIPDLAVVSMNQSMPTTTRSCFLTFSLLLLQGQRKLHVGFCLKLLEMCFKHVFSQGSSQPDSAALHQPEASIQRLAQLQTFARGMSPLAAGLDVKPFLVPYLPAQLLVFVITSTRAQDHSRPEPEGVEGVTALSSEVVSAGLADVHLAIVEELCLHCHGSNVHELAQLIQQLPSPTVLTPPSVPSMAAVELEFEFELSSSTAYTAAACSVLLEMPQLEPDGQTEACQEAVDYLQCLTPKDLQNLLLWIALDQPHPLIASGPQLPEQLPADLRLTLLQSGLQILLRQAEEGSQFEPDGKLELEANRLNTLCEVQQSCDLAPEQWGMVEQALTTIVAAEAVGAGRDGRLSAAKVCTADLARSGLTMEDVLFIANSLQSLIDVIDSQQPRKPQAAAMVSGVVHQQVAEAMTAVSSTSEGAVTLLDPQSIGSSQEGLLEQHTNGVTHQEGQGGLSDKQAVSTVLGILQSLQSGGTSAEGQGLITELRQHVWTSLQQHLFADQQLSGSPDSPSLQPAQLQLLEAFLALSPVQMGASIGKSTGSVPLRQPPGSPEKAGGPPPIHWDGWSLEQDSSSLAQGQQMLLVSRSRAVASSLWPGVALTSHDLGSHSAAQKLFLKLLGQADGAAQLHALQGLLADVWQNGQAIASDQV